MRIERRISFEMISEDSVVLLVSFMFVNGNQIIVPVFHDHDVGMVMKPNYERQVDSQGMVSGTGSELFTRCSFISVSRSFGDGKRKC